MRDLSRNVQGQRDLDWRSAQILNLNLCDPGLVNSYARTVGHECKPGHFLIMSTVWLLRCLWPMNGDTQLHFCRLNVPYEHLIERSC
jgi:hypothetical protein